LISLFFMPQHTAGWLNRVQDVLGYTQLPGIYVWGVLLADKLLRAPGNIGTATIMVGVAASALLQTAIMGFPVWLAIQIWRVRSARECSDTAPPRHAVTAETHPPR
jgi:hypothetical protein